jgi:hypothetical protein
VQPFASVAVIVMLALTEVVGVPLISPLEAFSTSPAGSVPELTVKVTGVAELPVALTVCE